MTSSEDRKGLDHGLSNAGPRTLSPGPFSCVCWAVSCLYLGMWIESEDIHFPANTTLDMSWHLGDLPNYQQRTQKKFFSVLKSLIMYMFSKAGPLIPLAPSGLKASPWSHCIREGIRWWHVQLQLEKFLMLGKIEGPRKRGCQRIRWLDSITNAMNMNLNKLWEMVRDKEACHVAVHGVVMSRTLLGNWTTRENYICCWMISNILFLTIYGL